MLAKDRCSVSPSRAGLKRAPGVLMGRTQRGSRVGAVERVDAARMIGISITELNRRIEAGEVLTLKSKTRRVVVPLSEIQRLNPAASAIRRGSGKKTT
jgi:hypothetical protein